MAEDLLAEIAETSVRPIALPQWVVDPILDSIVQRFGIDRKNSWWWEGLDDEVVTIPYTGNGFDEVHRLIAGWSTVVMVVTAENPEPAGVFVIREEDVEPLLGESQFFEYALVSSDLSTIVFDTHHNTLIVREAVAKPDPSRS